MQNLIKKWLGITEIEKSFRIRGLELELIKHDIEKLEKEVNIYPYITPTDNSLKEMVFGIYKYLNVKTDISYHEEPVTSIRIREYNLRKRSKYED